MALSKRAAFFSLSRLLVRTEMFCSRPFSTAGGGGVAVSSNDLVSKIMAVGAPNLSVVPLLDRWAEDGNTITYNFFQRMIRSLRERNRYSHALEVSEYMGKHIESSLFSTGDQAVQLDLIGHVRGVEAAESFFHGTDESHKNMKVYGALLSCYTRSGELEKSSSLAKKMKEMGFMKTPVAMNNMMTLYSRLNQHHRIPEILSEMKKEGILPNHYTYRMCLGSYGRQSDFDSLEKLLLEMESLPHFTVDWKTYASAANIYIAAGLKEKALQWLKKSEERAGRWAQAYNHLISLYAKLESKEEVLRVWRLQESMCGRHNNLDYSMVLSSLLRMKEADEAEGLLKQWTPVRFDMKVPNLVLSWLCRNGSTQRAEGLLKDVVAKGEGRATIPSSWTILAAGYEAEERMADAVRCFKEALAVKGANPKWAPRPEMAAKILRWVGENGGVDEVVGLVRGMKGVVEVEGVKEAVGRAAERGGVGVDVVFARIEAEDDDADEFEQSTA